MKKNKLVLIVLGLIFSININAQNDFKFGINAGLNYPDVRGSEYAKYQNFKVGYLFGVSIDYYIKNNLSIKSNINYENKIKELRITYFNNDNSVSEYKYFDKINNYINVPVLVKYEFASSKLFVNGGPFVNYLISDKITPEYPSYINVPPEEEKFDFGLSVGIGTIISLNDNNDLVIEIRDDLGLINTNNVYGSLKTNTLKLILAWNLEI